MEDAELLRRYADERSEEAFGEFVQRHINLVYSCSFGKRAAGEKSLPAASVAGSQRVAPSLRGDYGHKRRLDLIKSASSDFSN